MSVTLRGQPYVKFSYSILKQVDYAGVPSHPCLSVTACVCGLSDGYNLAVHQKVK